MPRLYVALVLVQYGSGWLGVMSGWGLISFWSRFGPRFFRLTLSAICLFPCLLVLILLYHSSTSCRMLNLDSEQQHVRKHDAHQNSFLESPNLILISFCRWNQRFLKPCFMPHHLFIRVNKCRCSYDMELVAVSFCRSHDILISIKLPKTPQTPSPHQDRHLREVCPAAAWCHTGAVPCGPWAVVGVMSGPHYHFWGGLNLKQMRFVKIKSIFVESHDRNYQIGPNMLRLLRIISQGETLSTLGISEVQPNRLTRTTKQVDQILVNSGVILRQTSPINHSVLKQRPNIASSNKVPPEQLTLFAIGGCIWGLKEMGVTGLCCARPVAKRSTSQSLADTSSTAPLVGTASICFSSFFHIVSTFYYFTHPQICQHINIALSTQSFQRW